MAFTLIAFVYECFQSAAGVFRKVANDGDPYPVVRAFLQNLSG